MENQTLSIIIGLKFDKGCIVGSLLSLRQDSSSKLNVLSSAVAASTAATIGTATAASSQVAEWDKHTMSIGRRNG